MRLIILIMLIVLSGLNCKAVCDDNPNEKEWYKHAEGYVYLDEKLIEHVIKEKDSFKKDYHARYQAETSLLHVDAPSNADIVQLLMSSSMLDRKVALVNVMLRKIYYSQDIYNRILSLLESENDPFTRFYCYHCFNLLDADKIEHYKDGLIDVFSNEEKEYLIIAGMPTLVKINSPRIVPIFLKYLDEGSEGLRRATCVYLHKLGKKYLEENKSLLEKKIEICGEMKGDKQKD
jgi:hypothetical protein